MKKIAGFLISASILGIVLPVYQAKSQVTEGEKQLRNLAITGETGWKTENNVAITFSQVSLTNWAAGGQNSISVNGRFNGLYNYKKEKMAWDSQVDVGYGILKQGKYGWQKTDDRFDLMSKLGYRFSDVLSGAALANFKTQFAPGYPGPDSKTRISDLLSPGYLLVAAGLDYKPVEWFTAFIAPLTAKMTLVLNDSLSQAGTFGVAAGKKFRAELGGYIRVGLKHDLVKNVNLATNIDLFSNYLKDPQYVDINWEVLVLMKINKFLSASINTLLIYDHDINIGKDTSGDGVPDDFGPRIQFKELVGIGLSFKIPNK